MISSDYLYGGLTHKMATMQELLFKEKLDKANSLLVELRPDFDVANFTDKQKDLEYRMVKINKAIEFCHNQIYEAREVLREPEGE